VCTNNSGARPERSIRGLKASGGTLELRSPNLARAPAFFRAQIERGGEVIRPFKLERNSNAVQAYDFPACRLLYRACYTFDPSSVGLLPSEAGMCWQSIRAQGLAVCVLWCFSQLEGDLSQNGISGK